MSQVNNALAPANTAANSCQSRPVGLQGHKRRVVFIGLYEAIAIAFCSVLFMATGQNGSDASTMAVITSTLAIVWNLSFNWMFEQWEAAQVTKGRSLWRRLAHAIGFEGGLAAMLVPLLAWWFHISLLEALALEAGLLLFFLVYTFVFNWAFDRVFGLPAAAQMALTTEG